MRPAAVVLLVVGILQILFALAATYGQVSRANPTTGTYVLAVFLGCCAVATIIVAGRGTVRMGERIGLMVVQGLLASCFGLGVVMVATNPPNAAGMNSTRDVFMFVFLLLAVFLPLASLPALAYLPPRAKPSRMREFGEGVIDAPPPKPGAGAKAALWGSIVTGAFFVVIVSGLYVSNQGQAPSGTGATSLAETRGFEDLNFEFESPGAPWVSLDPSSINPEASLVVRRVRPEIVFIIIAEAGGDLPELTSDTLADIAVANLKSVAPSSNVVSREPFILAGMDGRTIRSTARIEPYDFHYVNVVATNNGFMYQLITYGQISIAEQVEAAATELVSRFRLIDPDRTAKVDGTLIEAPLGSETFGLELDLDGNGWIEWQDIATDLPDAEFGALRNDGAAVAAVPVLIDLAPPNLDITTTAFLELVGFEYPGPEVVSVAPHERNGLEGYRIEASRAPNEDGEIYDYRFDVLQAERYVCLLACWWLRGVETARAAAIEALDSITIEPPRAWSRDILQSFDERQRLRHALFHNRVGLEYDELDRNAEELEWFREALRFSPDDAVIFENAVTTLEELGRIDDAARFLREHADRFTGVEAISRLDASLHARTGDSARARERYEALFASGYRNDEALRSFVSLLIEQNDAEAALQAAESYTGLARGADASIARADALVALERYSEAADLLRTAAEGPPFQSDALRHLVDVAYDLDHFNDAIDASDRLIAQRVDSANTWYMKGLSESALGWYQEAKSSLEEAQRRAPSSDVVRDELRYVSGLLGEGDNSAVRQPIDPVAIPSELLEIRPDEDWLERSRIHHGSSFDLAIRAYEFLPDERFRQTDLYRARVLDRRGRDDLGSFEFDFDPVSERIYVNHLRVLGADGALIHEGKPDEWYVLDDAGASGEASFDQTLHVPVAALEPGRTIEIMVTRERLNPPERLPWLERSLAMSAPAARSAVVLHADATVVVSSVDDRAEERSFENGRLWVLEDPEPIRFESRQPSYQDWVPMFRAASAGATWEALAADYLGDIADRLEISDAVRARAERLIAGLESADQRASTLARHVQESLTYRAIEFGRRAWRPSDADSIIHNRFGDCKDHALVLYQLLRASGIEAHLALVNTVSPIARDLPSIDQFNHMIVFVPDLETGRYIDVTDKYTAPILSAPYFLAGATALILDEASPRLVEIPPYDPSDYQRRCDRTVEITPEGTVAVDERAVLVGFGADAYRRVLVPLPRSEDEQTIAEWFTNERIEVEINHVAIENVDDPTADLIINVRYVLENRLTTSGDQLRVSIPTLWAAQTIDAPSNTADRRTPFEFHFPQSVSVITRVVPPSGYRAVVDDSFEATTDENAPFWRCASGSSDEGANVVARIDCKIPPGTHQMDRWGAYDESIRRTRQAFTQRFDLKPSN